MYVLEKMVIGSKLLRNITKIIILITLKYLVPLAITPDSPNRMTFFINTLSFL